MDVDITPINLDITKHLARLYPPARGKPGIADCHISYDPSARSTKDNRTKHVLDNFFAADFIPPKRKEGAGDVQGVPGASRSSDESYGVRYLRYLHETMKEPLLRKDGDILDALVLGIRTELVGRARWDHPVLEKILAYAIIVQFRIEQSPRGLLGVGMKLGGDFWKSKLPSHLWKSIQAHLAQDTAGGGTAGVEKGAKVSPNDVELAVEILYLFSNWSDDLPTAHSMGLRSTQRVCSAMQLFNKYSRQQQPAKKNKQAAGGGKSAVPPASSSKRSTGQGEVGKLQRARLGHKSLLLLEITWRLLVGDEADALRRINGQPPRGRGTSSRRQSTACDADEEDEEDEEEQEARSVRSLQKTGLARDALRQIRESTEKYALLAEETRGVAESLLPFVHPFDGHITRTVQLGRFGPIRTKPKIPQAAAYALPQAPATAALDDAQSAPMAEANAQMAQALGHGMGSPSTQMLLADMLARMDDTQLRQQQLLRQQQQTANGGGLVRELDDMAADMPPDFFIDRKPWFAPPPRAARDAIAAYVESARLNRSEREYAEWWRRLVHARGMPLSLTLNAAGKKGMNSDISINYDDAESNAGSFNRHKRDLPQPDARAPNQEDSQQQQQQQQQRQQSARRQGTYEFCGLIEVEDLPALEAHLDGKSSEIKWPASTNRPEGLEAYDTLYRGLFPLLPGLCKAVVLTIVNWAPADKELPVRQFLINVGPPQVSERTCFGIVKYPRPVATTGGASSERAGCTDKSASESNSSDSGNSGTAAATDRSSLRNRGNGRVMPASPLGGANVKRLERKHSSFTSPPTTGSSFAGSGAGSSSLSSSRSATALAYETTLRPLGSQASMNDKSSLVSTELAARLMTQYAQWQAIGGLMIRMVLTLQAAHVLQADYVSQLLMNENLIPAVFWWLGTANLDICTALPDAMRMHTFTNEYKRIQREDADAQAKLGRTSADRTAVGRDPSDAEGPELQEGEADAASTNLNADASMEGDEQDVGPATATHSVEAGNQAGSDMAGGSEPGEWEPALQGLYDCMRWLRRVTSHNGLRKGLLYKNKALHFYGRLLKVPCLAIRQIAAELYRDIMPVISKKQKQMNLASIAAVFLYAPASLNDAFWLSDYSLDPQIEMHRHVELLRLLHFYHHEAFSLRLPQDPALFPSLVTQAQEIPAQQGQQPQQRQQQQQQQLRNVTTPSNRHNSKGKDGASSKDGTDWLTWESDLEDTLDDIYATSVDVS